MGVRAGITAAEPTPPVRLRLFACANYKRVAGAPHGWAIADSFSSQATAPASVSWPSNDLRKRRHTAGQENLFSLHSQEEKEKFMLRAIAFATVCVLLAGPASAQSLAEVFVVHGIPGQDVAGA